MKPEREVTFQVQDGVVVAALWYGEPHNCWRVELRGYDLDGDLGNLTMEETTALAEVLMKACQHQEDQ